MKKLVNLPKFPCTRRGYGSPDDVPDPASSSARSRHKACWRAQSSLIHLSTIMDQHSALFAHQFEGT